ncbi:MAG TPA: hypothetical protein VN896_08765 [Methylomirabilota bacterium]|nr:hypothetical protein [Methylomirabilota bacterium]
MNSVVRRTFFTLIHSANAAEDPAPSPAEGGDEASSAQDNRLDGRRIPENAPDGGQRNHDETD